MKELIKNLTLPFLKEPTQVPHEERTKKLLGKERNKQFNKNEGNFRSAFGGLYKVIDLDLTKEDQYDITGDKV